MKVEIMCLLDKQESNGMNLTVAELATKILEFNRIKTYIPVFTVARRWSLALVG